MVNSFKLLAKLVPNLDFIPLNKLDYLNTF